MKTINETTAAKDQTTAAPGVDQQSIVENALENLEVKNKQLHQDLVKAAKEAQKHLDETLGMSKGKAALIGAAGATLAILPVALVEDFTIGNSITNGLAIAAGAGAGYVAKPSIGMATLEGTQSFCVGILAGALVKSIGDSAIQRINKIMESGETDDMDVLDLVEQQGSDLDSVLA